MATSIIGEDLIITGNIISKGEIEIEGEVQGDVYCSALTIGEQGQVTGGIVAEDVKVHGRVNGSINAIRVTLESSSHVEGDICHQALQLEHGGHFDGRSRRSDDPISAAAEGKERSGLQAVSPSENRVKPAKLQEAA
ncbi:MAG: hypothetical protein Kow0032_28570 [Methyloligellaceae bacterium]